jgi:hypothetical protein
MKHEVPPEALARWLAYVDAERAADAARQALFAQRAGLIELLRHGCHEPRERAAVLGVASRLPAEELQELFPELLALASFGHGLTEAYRQVILRLSRPWLRANIEKIAAPLLTNGDHEQYRALLELYARIDSALALDLARAAEQSSDPDIREAGADYLLTLDEHGSANSKTNVRPDDALPNELPPMAPTPASGPIS